MYKRDSIILCESFRHVWHFSTHVLDVIYSTREGQVRDGTGNIWWLYAHGHWRCREHIQHVPTNYLQRWTISTDFHVHSWSLHVQLWKGTRLFVYRNDNHYLCSASNSSNLITNVFFKHINKGDFNRCVIFTHRYWLFCVLRIIIHLINGYFQLNSDRVIVSTNENVNLSHQRIQGARLAPPNGLWLLSSVCACVL